MHYFDIAIEENFYLYKHLVSLYYLEKNIWEENLGKPSNHS